MLNSLKKRNMHFSKMTRTFFYSSETEKRKKKLLFLQLHLYVSAINILITDFETRKEISLSQIHVC